MCIRDRLPTYTIRFKLSFVAFSFLRLFAIVVKADFCACILGIRSSSHYPSVAHVAFFHLFNYNGRKVGVRFFIAFSTAASSTQSGQGRRVKGIPLKECGAKNT